MDLWNPAWWQQLLFSINLVSGAVRIFGDCIDLRPYKFLVLNECLDRMSDYDNQDHKDLWHSSMHNQWLGIIIWVFDNNLLNFIFEEYNLGILRKD